MHVFYTDLDNTLIYSHRRNINGDKIVVEYLNGREQSYMKKYTYTFLREAVWLNIIPVTSRTKEQLLRINCLNDLRINCAIVCNGGMLLIDGEEDQEWSKETFLRARLQIEMLDKAAEMLHDMCLGYTLHRPTPYMMYSKANNPLEISKILKKRFRAEQVSIHYDSRKVYLFAPSVNKGTAVQRMRNRIGDRIDIAAGDSYMDVPMLNQAIYALAGERIFEEVRSQNKTELFGNVISDQICDEIRRLHDLNAVL